MILQELAARSVRKESLTSNLMQLDKLSTMAARSFLSSQKNESYGTIVENVIQ